MTPVDAIRADARPLPGTDDQYDPLLELVGDARFVLLGEASHGTHEFYRERAEITKRLIAEQGFAAVAVEADWPDAYRVNRYVQGVGDDRSADEALRGFERFPAWMWRNRDVAEFVEWLRRYNGSLPAGARRVGFYGLDLYSLYASVEAVIRYLDDVDPEAAARARTRYSCFGHAGVEPQVYAYSAGFGAGHSCEDAAVGQLVELQRLAEQYVSRDGYVAEDRFFYAEQNARLVRNAERYYRTMFASDVSSWNVRDRHMAETLAALVEHLDRHLERSRVAAWEHNSHIGDARATQLGAAGELNVGQLARERWGAEVVLVGFTTHRGTVIAADEWGGAGERKTVRPALLESYEEVFHRSGVPRFLLDLRSGPAGRALEDERLERAIGVIYRPETERMSHYFYARLPHQFDAVLHFDETSAVEPLDPPTAELGPEPPETFPSAV